MVRPRSVLRGLVSRVLGKAPAETLLWQLVKEQRWWLWAAVSVSGAGFLAQIALAQAAVKVVDQGVENPTEPLGPLVVRMAVFGLVHVTLAIGAVLMMTRVRWTIEYRVRTTLHRSLLAGAVDDGDTTTGQVITRAVTDLGQLNNVVYLVPIFVASVPAVLSGMAYLGYLNFPLMLVTFSSIPINFWLIRRIRGRVQALSWLQLQETAEVTRAIDEPIRGIRVVKLFGREPSVIAAVRTASSHAYSYAITRVRLLARYSALLRLVPALSQAGLLLVGAWAMESGSLSAGQFLVFFVGSGQVVFFAQSFPAILDQWSFAKTGSNRIGSLVDPEGVGVGDRMVGDDVREPEPEDVFGSPRVGWCCEDLVFRFGPGNETEPLSMVVAPGETVVVRSPRELPLPQIAQTFVGSLMPAGGKVWVEDTDLHEMSMWSGRTQLRVIDSEPYLFARSIRENLLLGARSAAVPQTDEGSGTSLREGGGPGGRCDAALARALRVSRADEVVDSLPGGLDEVLGDRAMNLSGGQRQRLALAQALVAEPRVLVLVEALSGVHARMEAEIVAGIAAGYPHTSVLYLTTRPSAATAVDRVVSIERGADHPRRLLGDGPDRGAAHEVVARVDPEEGALLGQVPNGRRTDTSEHTETGGAVPDAAVPEDASREAPRCDESAEELDSQPTAWNLARPFRKMLTALSVVIIAVTIIELAPQYLFGLVNNAIDSGSSDTGKYALALVVLALVTTLGHWWFDVNAARLSNGMLYLLRTRLIRRLSRLGLAYYDRELPGYVATRVLHDLEEVTAFTRAVATRLAVVGLSLVAAMAAMALIGAQILLLIVAVIASALVLTAIEVPIARRAYLRQRAALGNVIARLEEDYNGRAAIDAAAAASEAEGSFDELAVRLRRADRWTALVGGFYSMGIQWIAEIGGALIMWRSGMLVLGGALSIGAMLTLRLYLQKVLTPVMEMGNLVQQYLRARVSFDRLRQPYEAAVLPVDRPDARACERLEGDIVLDDVSFTYPETDREVLSAVSLRLPQGKTIAVVGPTGAGKSTIAKLITRVYDPTSGSVRVGNDDLASFTTASLRRRIGVVPQEPFLFAGSVLDNIVYGEPEADLVAAERAVAAVGATDGLGDLEAGLSSPVLEEGINLTPQQRQLIALARAWLVQPDILVLDEATSALDETTELAVLRALGERRGTTIFVTHRDQVADAADMRLVVDGQAEMDISHQPVAT